MGYTLPGLPYAFDSLEPHIDARTMEIHHSKQHQTYVNNLNAASEGSEYSDLPVEALVAQLDSLPEPLRTPVRNNGGGDADHCLFWTVMSRKGGGEPTGELKRALDSELAGFDSFNNAFTKAALARFGSGWAWLTADSRGRLAVESTGNQDSPLMKGAMSGNTPILGLDVWEHACYLKYQNRRPKYIAAFYNVVDWSEVARRYAEAKAR